MADNVAITAGSGTTVAADEVVDATLGTVKAQFVKVMDGTLDSTNKLVVSAAGAAKVDGSAVTQPVSIATNTPDVTDRAARLLGHVTVDSAPSTAVTNAGTFAVQAAATLAAETTKVIGTVNVAAAQTIGLAAGANTVGKVDQGAANATPWSQNLSQVGGSAVTLGAKVAASSIPIVIASDQAAVPFTKVAATGQTNVLKTGTLVTTAVTADQVVLTYTVTAAKTFYLGYLTMYGRLTVLSATASILGAISLETPSGTKAITLDDNNPTTSEVEFNPIVFSEPIPIAAGVVIRVVVTPAATTSMTWRANFGGYEK